MSHADDYNAAQITAGKLTIQHISELTRFYQASQVPPLTVDGMAGPQTIASIDAMIDAMRNAPFLSSPLPTLVGGRRAVITNRFKTNNPSNPTHDGVDFFYHWQPGDKPDHVGDGGAAGRNPDGTPKWGVPLGTFAIAAAPGVVVKADNSKTGWRMWIDHGNGWWSGYFHLTSVIRNPGQYVKQGDELGPVGDNPNDKGDARHLHFEVTPDDRYEPVDPELYLLR